MTIDYDTWSEYFDSINVCADGLRAAVALARVPLSPARAGRPADLGAKGGLLEAISYDRPRDEIAIAICQNGASGATVRYFIASPRSVTVEDAELTKLICITDHAGIRTVVSIASPAPAFGARPRSGTRAL